MLSNRYERYVGFDQNELKYVKKMVVDEASGKEVEKLVKRTPQEVEEYKRQKEAEFDEMIATWERLGITKCVFQKTFDDKGFNKICLKLIKARLNELGNSNQTENIETDMLNSIGYVNKKYNINTALRYYGVEGKNMDTSLIFKGLNRSAIEKMFYRNISTETAGVLATNRLSQATTLNEGLALIQELQRTHNNRSFFFKLFHPFKNAEENRLIRRVQAEVMQKFNISKARLDSKLRREVNKSTLATSNMYKLDSFANEYCHENSGKLYSQHQIDVDTKNVSERAEDDFVESQRELEGMIEAENREQIVVDDARVDDEVERVSEPVKEDPKIINVPKNDNF